MKKEEDKKLFNDIKDRIDRSTNDILYNPDVGANLECVDLVSSVSSEEVIDEVLLLLRRKLTARQVKLVFLTLSLIETLVKNCGQNFHTCINKEPFIKVDQSLSTYSFSD